MAERWKMWRTVLAWAVAAGPVLAQSVADAPSRARAADGRYISWREHRIDDEGLSGLPLRGADGLAVADLDRDGHADVVSVHEDSSHVRIAFGSRDPDTWHNVTLASGPTVGRVEDVAMADLNGDGRLDVVCACERAHVVCFLAPERPRVPQDWKSVIIEGSKGRGSWIRVKLADMNDDGRVDVVGANKGRTSLSVFFMTAQAVSPTSWHEQIIGLCKRPINVRPVDWDGDGDLDLIGASRGEKRIDLYENLGAGRDWNVWPVHQGKPRSEGFMVEFADLNRDGRRDIMTEADHGGDCFWLEQPAKLGERWAPHVVGTISPDNATGLKLVDINGDGRLDLFVGGYSAGPRLEEPKTIKPSQRCGRLAWFEQPVDPTAPWTRHDVSRRRRGMYDMFLPCDLNRDGLVDFVTTRGNSGSYDGVLWLEQVRTSRPSPAFQQASATDSAQVPLPTP